jgi:hypothetical protein
MTGFIFFLCSTAALAEEAAYTMAADVLPPACSWTDEKQGTIDEVVADLRLPDGRIVQVGRVRMASGRHGYSAGLAPELY